MKSVIFSTGAPGHTPAIVRPLMRAHLLAGTFVLVALVAASCGSPSSNGSGATDSPTPTGSQTPTGTGTETPTPTATATGTGTATPNPTPASSCVSNFNWVLGDFGSSWMHPGVDCVGCHNTGGGPDLWVGGTVYAADGQVDDCGGAANVTVTITEANGTPHQLTTNYTGNFYIKKSDVPNFQFPYTVTLSANGQTRSMAASQTTGACNSCHTQTGAQGAPGRILSP